MPTYSYICENGHKYEEIRSMTENLQKTTCAETPCGTTLKRVFSAPPITFKGGGFHAKSG